MNSSHSLPCKASSRRACPRPGSGWSLVSGILLLTAGALAAAPSPTPKATPKPSVTPAATPAVTPAMTPAATASPTASASVSPTPEVKATYSGALQMQYMATARDAFLTLRQAKTQPFVDAHNALEAAGSISAKGLTSKEAIKARRDLVATCVTTNADYLAFAKGQEDTYRAELAKTPLVPNDVDSIVADYALHAKTATIVQVRQLEDEALKDSDNILAVLDKSSGEWTVNDAGKLTFKKKSSANAYSAAVDKYNTVAKEAEKMRGEINAAVAVPSASAPPAASPGATASPTASPTTPAASPSPTVSASPTPAVKPTASVKPAH